MSPRKEVPPPNLLKPYPATLNGPLCARCSGGSLDALCGPCARAEVRALRRERRALRKALIGLKRGPTMECWCLGGYHRDCEAAEKALATKARRAGRKV